MQLMRPEKISVIDRVRYMMHFINHRHRFVERQDVGAIFVCSRRIGPSKINLAVSPADNRGNIKMFDIHPRIIADLGQCENAVTLRQMAEWLALSYR